MVHTIPLRRQAELPIFQLSRSSLTVSRFGKSLPAHLSHLPFVLYYFTIHFPSLINIRVSFNLSLYSQNISENSFALRLRMVYHMLNQELTFYTSEFYPCYVMSGLDELIVRHMYGADCQENVPHREWLIMFERVINEVKAEMVQLGRPNDFIGAKVFFFFSKKIFSVFQGYRSSTLRRDLLHRKRWTGIWRIVYP